MSIDKCQRDNTGSHVTKTVTSLLKVFFNCGACLLHLYFGAGQIYRPISITQEILDVSECRTKLMSAIDNFTTDTKDEIKKRKIVFFAFMGCLDSLEIQCKKCILIYV